MPHDIMVLGAFMADISFRASRQPRIGETLLANGMTLGPGGKGSNQAVAAALAGGDVGLITRLGEDAFADLAHETWSRAGVTPLVKTVQDAPTGSAFIFVDEATGDNAILIEPGAARGISPSDVNARAKDVAAARVLLVQLEQPVATAECALAIARDAGVITILDPAPAAAIPDSVLSLCDYVTPNETEAEILTGIRVATVGDAELAARCLCDRGAGGVFLTRGEHGAYLFDGRCGQVIPALPVRSPVDTTAAGDAFNGALAVAFANCLSPFEAGRFANAGAALAVSRRGAAASMPDRDEIMGALCSSRLP